MAREGALITLQAITLQLLLRPNCALHLLLAAHCSGLTVCCGAGRWTRSAHHTIAPARDGHGAGAG
eukprot:1161807-Pelagomonas_calceolata.AAC.5